MSPVKHLSHLTVIIYILFFLISLPAPWRIEIMPNFCVDPHYVLYFLGQNEKIAGKWMIEWINGTAFHFIRFLMGLTEFGFHVRMREEGLKKKKKKKTD